MNQILGSGLNLLFITPAHENFNAEVPSYRLLRPACWGIYLSKTAGSTHYQILNDLSHLFDGAIERHQHKPFLKAAMAACALVAAAHGKISFSQRMKIDEIMETTIELKVFDPHEGAQLFDTYIKQLEHAPESARQQLHEVIKAVIDCEQTADSLLRFCENICQTYEHSSSEVCTELKSLCELLGGSSQYTHLVQASSNTESLSR